MKKLLLISFLTLSSSVLTLCNAQYTDIYNFTGTTGSGQNPTASLTLSGNVFYGTTYNGGYYDYGMIFSIDTNGSNFKDLWDFNDTSNNGANPHASLTIIGNKLYGTTFTGGLHNNGIIFSINTDGSGFTDMFDFNQATSGSAPQAGLALYGTKFYGMALDGGANNLGDLYSINTDGTGFTDIFDFNSTTGQAGWGTLTVSQNGNMLFGMNAMGGTNTDGMVFSVATNGSYFKDVMDFTVTNGSLPYGSLLLNGNILYGMSNEGGVNRDGSVFAVDTDGKNYLDLHDFDGTDGMYPWGGLVLAPGNVLYGMTSQAGTYTNGNIFSVNTDGSNFKSIYLFQTATGANPYGDVTIVGDALFGMTEYFGTSVDDGVIFRYNDPALAINKVDAKKGAINVYPDPSNGQFTFKSTDVSGNSSIEIYNALGQQVYSQTNITNKTFNINLSCQPSGTYLYRVIAMDGSLTGQGNLVIQK